MSKVNYNQISNIYDQVRRADIELLNNMIKEAEITVSSKILDIGCGTANYTNILSGISGADVYGVDASAGMIDKARNKNDQIIFKITDVSCEAIPFQDGTFDFIYMTDVIHHIADYDHLFAEIKRILKSRAKVCIATQSHQQIEQRYMSEFFPETAAVDKKRYPTISEIARFASKYGFINYLNNIIGQGEEIELTEDFLRLLENKGYSMLHLISEEGFQKGLSLVREKMNQGALFRKYAGDTLIWLQKA